MYIQKRECCFETNSSSTHSITTTCNSTELTNKLSVHKDGFIKSSGGEFGWEYNEYNDAQSKLDYLVSYLFYVTNPKGGPVEPKTKHEEEYKKLKEIIKEFTGAELQIVATNDIFPFGYIDHESEYLARKVLEGSKEDIKNFIFNPCVVLITDNDNDVDYWYDDE